MLKSFVYLNLCLNMRFPRVFSYFSETVLLSTQSICIDQELEMIVFNYHSHSLHKRKFLHKLKLSEQLYNM